MTDEGHDMVETDQGLIHARLCFQCEALALLGPDGSKMLHAWEEWWEAQQGLPLTPLEAARLGFFAGIAWGMQDVRGVLSQWQDLCLAEALVQAKQDYDDEMEARFERERDRWLDTHDPGRREEG